MGLTILLGAQWGDEGKGRVTDLLSEDADVTARFSGGDNAGHTVTVGGAAARTFKLHLLPSGVIQPRTVNVLGNGMVINPARLRNELAALAQTGITLTPERLKISHAAHLITPAHVALDQAEEDARGADKIGTTGRGIGPAYTAKIARGGLRAELLSRSPRRWPTGSKPHVAQVNRTLTQACTAPAARCRRHRGRVRRSCPGACAVHHRDLAVSRRPAEGRRACHRRGRPGFAARHRPRHLSVRHKLVADDRRGPHRPRGRAALHRPHHRRHQGLPDPRRRRPIPDRGLRR